MGLTWLHPWTWLAAVAVALPIAIHLLARHRSRRLPFPTIRFLSPTPLAAVSPRTLQDMPLLLVRILLVLLSIAALAGPIVVTPEREARWASHVARAIVLDDQGAPTDDERRSAAVSAVFARADVGDAVADAVRWLNVQSPAHREIVVLSAFRRGVVVPADFSDVPPEIGVRLVRTGDGHGVREREIVRLQWRGRRVVRVTERVSLTASSTDVLEARVEPLASVPITVDAAPDQREDAEAALRAVLRRGVLLPPAGLMQPVSVRWTGDAVALANAIDARLAAPLSAWEPEVASDAELDAMARPSSRAGIAVPVDEGDRRLLWGLMLIVLALESWMRWGRGWS
jgi:hypothetical protein